MIEIERDAATPMLRKYSMWTADTARVIANERSSGSGLPAPSEISGIVVALTSAMMRNGFLRYSALACTGMSDAG